VPSRSAPYWTIALTRARELAEADLSQATGGLPLPPGLLGAG